MTLPSGLCLVTGATGFVGSAVARVLLKAGQPVRVLARPRSDRRNLKGLSVEIAPGSLEDPASLAAAVAGCRYLFHVAADYRLWVPDPAPMFLANVGGTRELMLAALAAGVERIVYTSSVATLGIVPGGIADEETSSRAADMIGPYKRSKFLAERVAEEYAARGLPVVIVNPTNPIGPWEVKPTPTGQMIVDYLLGRMFATLDTGLNLIHVADVARRHLLAARVGRAGEKYILGCENHSLAEIFGLLERITGIRAPRLRVPHALVTLVALGNEALARATGRPPRVPLTGVRMARKRMYFSADKAVRELTLPQTPVEQALRDAVDWFVAHGYAPPPPAFRRRVA
jgi:dihydroflavonol-4-reductase